MLVSVESQTLSAVVSKIYLRSEPPSIDELMVAWRRRRRLRRILTALRQIRRSQPRLRILYQRERQNIYVELQSAADCTWFMLLWPTDRPKWIEVSGSEWPKAP